LVSCIRANILSKNFLIRLVKEHPSVVEATLIVSKLSNNEKQLALYFTVKSLKDAPRLNELGNFLKEYLPGYMIPIKLVLVEKFPLTPNGKIDKMKLCEVVSKVQSFKRQYYPPTNNTEEILVVMWRRCLKIKGDISVTDGFFELGGHSLLVIKLLSRINTMFNVSISVQDILESQSIYRMAKVIRRLKRSREESESEYSEFDVDTAKPIVKINEEGKQLPLFLIHPGGGTVFCYLPLANILGDDQPLYGIQDPAVLDSTQKFTSLEEMATSYIKYIKEIQPKGPYYLGGYSFGGVVAWEIVNQLILKGEEVDCLMLFDSWAKTPPEFKSREFFDQIMKQYNTEYEDDLEIFGPNHTANSLDLAWSRLQLSMAYKPKKLSCKVVLFKAHDVVDIYKKYHAKCNRWSKFVKGPIEVHLVPGYHHNIFSSDNVHTLGGVLKTSLESIRKISASESPKNLDGSSQIIEAERSQKYILSNEERNTRLIEWNQTDKVYPDYNLNILFEDVVETCPAGIAAVFNGSAITYEKLNTKVNQFANYLISKGVESGQIVGIYLKPGFEMLVALLGVLKTGAAYAPIHFATPPSRLEYIQSSCAVVVTQKQMRRKFESRDRKIVCIDIDWQHVRYRSMKNPNITIQLADVACILYCSVTSTNPQGIIVSHKSISNFIYWTLSEFSKDQLSGVLASTPLAYDQSIFEIFAPLCYGGCVHLVNDIHELPDVAFADNITLISTIPSFIEELLARQAVPQSVKTLVLAKEQMNSSFLNEVFEKTKVELIYNGYIKSEVGFVTFAKYPRGVKSEPNIGKPIANTKLYVLNEHMESVQIGCPGELYISGKVLSDGYLNDSLLTSQKFIDNPFDDGYEKLYKTNDKVCWLSDGSLDYLGRLDRGVILKGLHVEPEIIEKLLMQHEGIEDVKIITEVDEKGEKHLVVYFVPDDSSVAPNYLELTEYLKQYVFPFVIPSVFIQTSKLPEDVES